MTTDFEKLGLFYLGKSYDLAQGKVTDDLLLYDSKDLTTHAVCVGMTGSGKTGLCLSLLEEAAIDGIPVIAIDPKGDLGNLLLTFPQLRGEDFRPWIEEAEAARQGINADELAAKTAEKWKKGLADWGQSGERIEKFRQSAEVVIYTPASNAGIPLTILRSFAAPPPALRENNEAMRDRVMADAGGLLGLLGLDADPISSREHILLCNLLDKAWREGKDMDLATLIRQVQQPPFETLGVIDLDTFFPPKDRTALAMQLNNLLASPGFSAWRVGEPLDVAKLLHTPQGKPKISIISVAHLGDNERMFFVTLLLNEILTWVRSQSGTTSLRAILYMDEVFGYFPPTANPPSKLPMLTLLKQARAYGLGIVLATQNPVDLDYKGLSNTGTWFLGRLQTERDKMRVLEGLEGAAASAGAKFDRAKMEQTLAGLSTRVFLMNNVHEDEPVVFQSRFALSFLRGPITRNQIEILMQEKKAAGGPPASKPASPQADASEVAAPAGGGGARPVLPPEVPETYFACDVASAFYHPAILGVAKVHFGDARKGIDYWQTVTLLQPIDGGMPNELWTESEELEPDTFELANRGGETATFGAIPSELMKVKCYASIGTALKNFLYRERRLTLWTFPETKEASQPEEPESVFRARLAHGLREKRDADVEKIKAKYAAKLQTLDDQIRRAEQRVEREKAEANQSAFGTMLSAGTAVFSALLGRKMASQANLSKAATAARSASKAMRDRGQISQAAESVEVLVERKEKLVAELEAEIQKIEEASKPDALVLETLELKPKKTDMTIDRVCLAWLPYKTNANGGLERAW
jgi:hypothetical protein